MKESKLHTRYFRISIIDSCNLNCYFCHKEGQSVSSNVPYLSADDFIWVASIAVELGFLKFKITGGEPTLRDDLSQIISGIKKTGANDVSLITNGIRLSEMSSELFDAGLDRVNVSIYSFEIDTFRNKCSGSVKDIDNIVNGIDTAIKAGFTDIKLNFILNNTNRMNDFKQTLMFAKERNLRILLLPLLNCNVKPEDEIFFFEDLYKFIKSFGINKEEIITDNEGFRQKQIVTNSGNKILLRLDYLSDRKIFDACFSCQHRDDCLEGILPLRLSSTGKLIPCLAKGIPEIDVREVIKSREKTKLINIINRISEL